MPSTAEWQRLFRSRSPEIRVRAAKALLKRDDTPMEIVLEILDHYWSDGLGAEAERVLIKHQHYDLFEPMIQRLRSQDPFVREVACNVLGRTRDWNATQPLLEMLNDPDIMVRRAAGFALAFLGDPSALETLKRQLEARRNDNINVRWAIEAAIQNLDSDTQASG